MDRAALIEMAREGEGRVALSDLSHNFHSFIPLSSRTIEQRTSLVLAMDGFSVTDRRTDRPRCAIDGGMDQDNGGEHADGATGGRKEEDGYRR